MLRALWKWMVHIVAFRALVLLYRIEAQTAVIVEWYLEGKTCLK